MMGYLILGKDGVPHLALDYILFLFRVVLEWSETMLEKLIEGNGRKNK